jgi:nitronate monooxygenase
MEQNVRRTGLTLQSLLGIDLPIIQAPTAGVQGVALAVAVSNAGGLGSLPDALLSPGALRQELVAIRAQTVKPVNANFFCHAPPIPNAEREVAWRATLAPSQDEWWLLGGDPPAR